MTDPQKLNLTLSADGSASSQHEEVIADARDFLLTIAERLMSEALRKDVTASDMVQQTLVAAIRDQSEFRGNSPQELRRWLIQILKHRIIDEARRAKVRRKLTEANHGQLVGSPTTSETTSALSDLVAQETVQKLLSAIECLDSLQKYIVQSRYIDSMTFEQIGEHLNLSHDSVRRLWLKAIQKLGQHLNEKGLH